MIEVFENGTWQQPAQSKIKRSGWLDYTFSDSLNVNDQDEVSTTCPTYWRQGETRLTRYLDGVKKHLLAERVKVAAYLALAIGVLNLVVLLAR